VNLITAKEFGMTLREWQQLKRWEQRLIRYFRIMESYYTENAHERSKRESEMAQKRQTLLSRLPKQMPGRR